MTGSTKKNDQESSSPAEERLMTRKELKRFGRYASRTGKKTTFGLRKKKFYFSF